MTKKARISVRSFHWVIVEQQEDPETTYILEEGQSILLPGLSDEPHEFRLKRITRTGVVFEITGSYLVLVNGNTSIGDGQSCAELSLKVGESRKVATPTLDAGIVWNICLEEII